MKKNILAAFLAVTTVFTLFAANPESDFYYDLADKDEVKFLAEKFPELNPSEDYIVITGYKGNVRGEKIEIPEEIEGCKVIKLSMNLREIYVKNIVIPASVVYFKSTYGDSSQLEFLRDKNSPFIWEGYAFFGKPYYGTQEFHPVDRKIIFLYNSGNYSSNIYISVPEKNFTWPKNWSFAGLYKNVFLGGDNQFHWVKLGYKFPDSSRVGYPQISFKESEEIELSFEEGYEELPIRVSDFRIKKLILPKSLKIIKGFSFIKIGDDGSKGTIVFPEGAKISIEPKSIDCKNLSISTKKALSAMGYNTSDL